MFLAFLRKATAMIVFLAAFSAYSQTHVFFESYPHSGAWFAMDGSNTGLFLDIQNGTLAGAYFGFDNDGNTIWLLFNGELDAVVNILPGNQLSWIVQAPLTQGANGGCILDCGQVTNMTHSSTQVAEIFIEFTGRNNARFRIDSGQLVSIIPLYFGSSAITSVNHSPQGLFAQPDLQGEWVAFQGNRTAIPGDFEIAESAGIIEIGEQELVVATPDNPLPIDVTMITHAPITRDTAQLYADNSGITCVYSESPAPPVTAPPTFKTVTCGVTQGIPETLPAGNFFAVRVPPEMMTDSRFIVFSTDQDEPFRTRRVEAFKLGYD